MFIKIETPTEVLRINTANIISTENAIGGDTLKIRCKDGVIYSIVGDPALITDELDKNG